MWLFYVVAVLLMVAGGVAWKYSNKIVWWEWLISGSVAIVLAVAFQFIAVIGMTDDIETWSGQIAQAHYRPAWLEYYEEAIYRTEYYTTTESYTDSKGRSQTRTVQRSRRVFDHWESRTRMHSDKWDKSDTFGREWSISKGEYDEITGRFGKTQAQPGTRTTGEHASRMISGDPKDYFAVNIKGYIYPVTMWKHWENRIKAAPTAFSFPKVDEKAPVFEYPENQDPFSSDRVLGTAKSVMPALFWDQMNARLGPSKLVNVVLVGFGTQDSSVAEMQKSKWIGGKKNDLVLCYGGSADPHKATWAKVFSWSEADVMKYNLQTIILENEIRPPLPEVSGAVEKTRAPGFYEKVEAEIAKNFVVKDWHQFDYIDIEPPLWSYLVYFITIALVQGGLWWFFWNNDEDKDSDKTPMSRYRSRYGY
jgi:hypothetical protein